MPPKKRFEHEERAVYDCREVQGSVHGHEPETNKKTCMQSKQDVQHSCDLKQEKVIRYIHDGAGKLDV